MYVGAKRRYINTLPFLSFPPNKRPNRNPKPNSNPNPFVGGTYGKS